MITIDQGLWNTLFSWMTPKQCMLPEGCTVPLIGVGVYVAIAVFVVAMAYWYRDIIKQAASRVHDRLPLPF